MSISAAGRRHKGRRFEREIAEMYHSYEIDHTAEPMPMSGAMDHHKGDILKKHDKEVVDECKNQESISIWACWRQTASQARGLEIPALHLKKNNIEPLTVMTTKDWFNLRKELKDLREEVSSRPMRIDTTDG